VNMRIAVVWGWAPESACTPGQDWAVLGSDARSGAKGAFPSISLLESCTWDRAFPQVPGLRLQGEITGEIAGFGG